MLTATDLKNGTTFVYEGRPYKVIKYAFSKVGRGGATVTVSIRNLDNGNFESKTFNSTVRFDEIQTRKRSLQYLFNDGITATFMDPTTFDQIEVPFSIAENELAYIKEGELVDILFWNEKPLSVDIPPKVTLKVVETAPGIKGNSASNMYKPAKLENGLEMKVPLFIKEGDKIRVDTRTETYVERVN